MKTVNKSQRLGNVHYEVRGPLEVEAALMEQRGEKVLKLNIGNPACFGFSAPQQVLSAMSGNAERTQHYTDPHGDQAARQAILDYSHMRGIPDVTLDHIYTGNGVSELIQISMDALLNPGDEILIPSPDYPLWTAAATMSGGTVVHYHCDEQSCWYPDIDDIKSKVSDRTKGIVIINPNNPTGAVYPKEVLERIVEIAREQSLIIFSDEIYDRLLLDDDEYTSIASLAPDLLCLTFNGLSKSHMLCGYRVGWMILSGNTEPAGDYIEGINMLSSMRLCSNVPGQFIIPEALSGAMRSEEYFIKGGRVDKQRNTVYEMLNSIPGVSAVRPKAAFYIFPKIDAGLFNIQDDREFALDLLKKEKILIVPGSGFNWKDPDHLRIVYLPEVSVLTEAVSRIGNYLDSRRTHN